MEEGALRCDANVSIRPVGETTLGTRTEVKNMNSFRGVERALSYEIERQTKLVESGGTVQQQTLLWDEKAQSAHPMRSKEESSDYRYFPEPDLLPLRITNAWIDEVRNSLPELPGVRAARFAAQFGIPVYDATVLTEKRALADYYEETVALFKDAKKVSNWIMTEVLRAVKDKLIPIGEFSVRPAALAEMFSLVEAGTISGKMAKDVFEQMIATGKSAKDIVAASGATQISGDDALIPIIEAVIAENAGQVEEYRGGKAALFGFFVGQTMKRSQGRANPNRVNELLKERLGEPAA
jgi:aspartyl-tRNA(Asn)/glutamyl-tRNA(Gln) amidotransferase subunit B